jgi:carbonic anhydrase
MVQELLAGNRRFVANEFDTHRDHYKSIAQAQTPKFLWIGCSDSRVSESTITGTMPGTIFVHRNVANIVAFNDVNVAAFLDYGVSHLHIPDIIVCGHTRCGGIAAIDAGIEDHYIADWLLIANGAKVEVNRVAATRPLSRDERLNLLIEENIKLQIRHLKDLSIIKHRKPGVPAPRVHGWVYDVDTGRLRVVVDGNAAGTADDQ